MKINVIATGSSGNLYELVDKIGNSMIIEAGMPRAAFVKYRIGKEPPEMCVISHKHMDHYHNWGEFAAICPTYVFERENVSENWKALGFEMKHGEGKTMVYIVKSLVENQFLFFGTDFEPEPRNEQLFEYLKMLKVENFLIECNYNDYLLHMEDVSDDMKKQCKRHLGDNDLIKFIKEINPKSPKIITIHGSNRLSADTYTKKYLNSKLLNATVAVATGAKSGTKNLFNI